MSAAYGKPLTDLASAEQDQQVVELKRQGLSFAEIAGELAISKSQAHRAFHRGLNRIPAEDVKAYRDEQLQHIALAREVVLDVLASYTQNIIVGRDGEVVENGEDHGPVLAAVDRLVKLDGHEAKLLGAYAKTQIEHSGGVTYEVVGVDLGKLT